MFIHYGELYLKKQHIQLLKKEPDYVKQRYHAVALSSGLIDDVRIYDKPLSAEEIQEIYNVNNPPEPPSIDGPTQGNVGVVYEWSLVSTDPDGDDVTYYIGWGDVCGGAEWHGPYPSGEEVIVVHKLYLWKHIYRKCNDCR